MYCRKHAYCKEQITAVNARKINTIIESIFNSSDLDLCSYTALASETRSYLSYSIQHANLIIHVISACCESLVVSHLKISVKSRCALVVLLL